MSDKEELFPSDVDSGSSDSSSSSGSSSDSSSSGSSVAQAGRKRVRGGRSDDYPIPKRLRRFLDIEAGEGDEEEEEEELDEEGLAERRAVRHRELDRLRREVATRKKAGTHRLKTVIDEIEERAKRADLAPDSTDLAAPGQAPEYEEDDMSMAEEGVVSRMPTLEDDKLFMVKVNEAGKERQIIAQLITKAAATRERGCKSFFTTDGVRGFIYVEAPSESAVRKFLQGIRSVQSYSAKIVPFNEQLAVFKAAVKAAADRVTAVPVDAWVRVKRHPIYAGDLGRVRRDLGEDGVEILLVPRVDVDAVRRGQIPSASGRGARGGGARVASTFFDRVYPEISDLVDRVKDKELGEYVYQLGGDRYTESGYLVRRFARKNLEISDVHVDISEVRAFLRDVVAEDEIKRLAGNKEISSFFLGEQVRVVSGDLRGVQGVVREIFGDRSRLAIEAASVKSLKSMEFGFTEVVKVWTAGQHVALMSGPDQGETGLVVKSLTVAPAGGGSSKGSSQGDKVVVLLDGDHREVTIESNGLKEASDEKAAGETTVEGVSVGDLVVLRSSVTGVVVRLSKSGNFVLLSTQGDKISGHVHEVTNRRPNQRGAFAVSKHGDAFGLGSSVKVGSGEGVVEYMVGNAVFVKLRGKATDHGFVVVKAAELEVLLVQDLARPRGGPGGPGAGGPAPPRPAGPASAGGGGSGSRGVSLGKVRIIKGTYKGYTGTIRDMQDTKVQVSLDAKFKVITIPKDQVRAIDSEAGSLAPPPMSAVAMSAVGLTSGLGTGALYRPPTAVGPAVVEPRTPAIFEEVEEEEEVAPWWLKEGVAVHVDGERGAVMRISEGRVRVKINTEIRSVRIAECGRVKPKQGDRVKVLARGPLYGLEGELMGFQNDDAVIMADEVTVVDANDVVTLP